MGIDKLDDEMERALQSALKYDREERRRAKELRLADQRAR